MPKKAKQEIIAPIEASPVVSLPGMKEDVKPVEKKKRAKPTVSVSLTVPLTTVSLKTVSPTTVPKKEHKLPMVKQLARVSIASIVERKKQFPPGRPVMPDFIQRIFALKDAYALLRKARKSK